MKQESYEAYKKRIQKENEERLEKVRIYFESNQQEKQKEYLERQEKLRKYDELKKESNEH